MTEHKTAQDAEHKYITVRDGGSGGDRIDNSASELRLPLSYANRILREDEIAIPTQAVRAIQEALNQNSKPIFRT